MNTPLTSLSEPVLVPVLPRYAIVLHPMVMRVLLGSSLVGRTLQRTRECAISDTWSGGILWNMIGRMVLVPATHCCFGKIQVVMVLALLEGGELEGLMPIPWHNQPSLLE